jgi:hypothetical protein
MSMLFGLPVSGSMSYSPLIVTNAKGPAWITGGLQGPEGSAFAVLVSFLLLFWMVRVTGDLKHKYGFAAIVPAGIPVDLNAASRAQHEAAMGETAPQQPLLVQILPAQPAAPTAGSEPAPEQQPLSEVPPSTSEPQ